MGVAPSVRAIVSTSCPKPVTTIHHFLGRVQSDQSRFLSYPLLVSLDIFSRGRLRSFLPPLCLVAV